MNNSIRQISQVFVGSAIALTTFSVQPVIGASLYDQIFIFGDSLSDPGNLFNDGQDVPSGFDGGRFSNGPVWSEYFAWDLGLEPELWIQSPDQKIQFIPDDGINFAIAGAKTDNGHIALPDEFEFGLRNQVDAFIDLLGGERLNNPQALGVLIAGANDYGGGQSNHEIPVRNLLQEIKRLSDAGLKNILVGNQPDLGKTPSILLMGEPTSQFFTGLTIDHNNFLETALENFNEPNDTNLILLDFYSLFNNVLDNPRKFGFRNVSQSCTNIDMGLPPEQWPEFEYLNGCREDLEDEFLFFDNVHPSTVAHRLIANQALRSVSTPEPSAISALGFLGMGLLAFKGRAKKKEEKMVVAK